MSSSSEEDGGVGVANAKVTAASRSRYRDRAEWADLQPVPQSPQSDNASRDDVVAIHYSSAFIDVYDYFRGILKVNEKSLRAFQITEDALQLNPANYTVWQYRREIIQTLNLNLDEELQFLEEIIKENPKNYQVWHHRQVIVQWKNDASKELELTESILDKDPKNYHAWQHRQWVIKIFGLYDEELRYVEYLINNDVRNNSAWNQRYFVVSNTSGFPEEVMERELEFTTGKIEAVPDNESSWNYLRGVLMYDNRGLSRVSDFCESLYRSGSHSPHLYALIIDICEEVILKEGGNSVYNNDRAVQLCDELQTKYDVIRSRYWKYMSNKFTAHCNRTQSNTNSITTN